MKTKLRSLPQFLKEISKEYKHMIPLMFLLAILQGVAPLINIVLPKYILDELILMKRINVLLLYIGGLAIGNFIFQMAISLCKNKLDIYINTLMGFRLVFIFFLKQEKSILEVGILEIYLMVYSHFFFLKVLKP